MSEKLLFRTVVYWCSSKMPSFILRFAGFYENIEGNEPSMYFIYYIHPKGGCDLRHGSHGVM